MKTEVHTMAGAFCALVAMGIMAGGCGKPHHGDPAGGAGTEGHEAHGQHEENHGDHKEQAGSLPDNAGSTCGADDGCGRGGEDEAGASASLDERANAPCEHAVPIYRCDACRYETGLVKLAAGILKQGNGEGLVRTQAAARTGVTAVLSVTGEVALNENATVHISPRIAGIVDTVSADIGALVKAGDTLLTLTSVDLGRALADYDRNRALTDLSERVFKRESKLREQNVGSEQDVIEAQMAFEQHRTDLKASEQMLHVLGLTEEEVAGLRDPPHGVGAGRLHVRAPFAGTVIEKHAVTGELAEPGKDVLLLSSLTTLWVWGDVHSRDLAALLDAAKRGPVTAEIGVAAFPDRPFRGTLDYIGATMNEETRTVKVRATVENPDVALRPGMFCDVRIAVGNGGAEEVLAVPRTAVFTDEGRSFVFRHWKDDFFARQDVRTGREFAGKVEILDGLQAGDVIVSEGGFLLKSDVLREKMGAGCAD
jgi:cobalt-zinc-cadmium efflux system membrane fusion protein